jgi:alpha-amylase
VIAAEDLAEGIRGSRVSSERRDTDMDGIDEVRLADDGQVVVVDLAEGAGIGSWDIRPVRHALTAVMRRRPETYHAKLTCPGEEGRRPRIGRRRKRRSGIDPRHRQDKGTRPRRPARLRRLRASVGPHPRLPSAATAEAWAATQATDFGDLVDGPFEIEVLETGRLIARRATTIAGAQVHATKTIELGGDRAAPTLTLTVDLEHGRGPEIAVRIGVEWSFTMLGGGGNPAAWWEVGGTRSPHDGRGSADSIDNIAQGNDDIGIRVISSMTGADAWWSPIETVSNSEDGFERVYQGSGLLLSWPVTLRPGERWSKTITNTVETTLP